MQGIPIDYLSPFLHNENLSVAIKILSNSDINNYESDTIQSI